MDLKSQALDLMRNLAGHMNASPYDIAWMARLPAGNGDGAHWPDLIDWLVENQWPDGSWGSRIPYFHDRIICTLAAIIALKERGAGSYIERAVKAGERYVWHNLHLLRRDPFELVGFELILPTLLMDALDLALDVPVHTCGYGQIRLEKLRLIPQSLIYSPRVTTIHSLEFLGKKADPTRLREAMAVNGSMGNSPATTSYYLLRVQGDKQALDYLEMVKTNTYAITCLSPFRVFDLTWTLNNLAFSELPLNEWVYPPLLDELQDTLTEAGISLDPTFPIEDGDTTAVTMRLLLQGGYPVDPMILKRFENKQIFRTFDYERNVSVSTNIHALETLAMLPQYPRRREVWDTIVTLLLAQRMYDIFWVDKWHASPYYATSHVLVGLLRVDEPLISECVHSVDWLLRTQREDGSWGFFDRGTVEETAYVLTALLHYHQRFPIDRDLLRRGAAYLYRAMTDWNNDCPALWIDKCLYVPYDIVRAAILATMMLYEHTFGRPPE